ncbi:MAG: hypothetical protein DRO98_02835, partial [Archaeoglobales archaeon]
MDKEKLKQVLVDLRDLYKEEWEKVKNDIFQHFKEIREIVKSNEEIDFETAKKIHEKIEAANNLTKPFLLWFWPSPYGKSTEDIENIRTEILNNPESRKTLIEAEKLQHLSDIDNFKGQIEAVLKDARGVKIATYSSWLCIFNPELFMPTWSNTINKQFRDVFNVGRFWGGEHNPEEFVEFTKTVKEVAGELGIDSMIEVAFYLSKYLPNTRKRIEQILEKVEISKEEFEKVKEIINKVREELLSRIDELKEKGWENGWDILNQLNKVPYIDFRNIPRAFDHKELPKILVDYINRLKDAKNLEEIRKFAEEVSLQLRDIPHINTTQLLHLSHIIRPDLFIPVTQWQISKSICYIYDNTIDNITDIRDESCREKLHYTSMEKISNVLDLINDLRSLAEEINLLNELPEDERTTKFSLILYKYGGGDLESEVEEKKDELDEELKKKIETILETKRQVILYGPPGTGKTWVARNYVKEKTKDNRNYYEFVTFHPSYSYEEFVEGIRLKTDDSGRVYYEIEDGIFKQICK